MLPLFDHTLHYVCGYTIHIRQLINLLPSFVSLGLGFGIGLSTNFPDAIVVGLDSCWLNVTPQSQCPKDREHVTHPYVSQHPEK